MFGEHVSRHLSAYCHGELAPAESRRVSEHLLRCTRCRREYDEVRLGADLARRLGPAEAPDDLWRDIAAAIDGTGVSAARPDPRGVRASRDWRGLVVKVAAAACVVLAAGLTWLGLERRAAAPAIPPPPSLAVASLGGMPLVDSSPVTATGRLPEGSWLVTDASSRAEIRLRDIGAVHVEPNSRVRLVETARDAQRLELARGRVSATVIAPPRLFFIDTPTATAVDLGCAYTLEVDDLGATILRVTAGWVALAMAGGETEVPAGAVCRTLPEGRTGTPYFEDASPALRAAVDLYDTTSDATALPVVLREARARDTLTLWNLLPRVDRKQRELLYVRMVRLTRPCPGVTLERVVALDADALARLRSQLQADW
jgi:hypothetical protein